MSRSGRDGVGRLLGQANPSSTTAASIYAPGAGRVAEISLIIVTEVSGNADTFDLHFNATGSTYAVGNALAFNKAIIANGVDLDFHFRPGAGLWLKNPGSIGFAPATASRLTVSIFGMEHEAIR